MTIKTEHNGHSIEYLQARDVWWCHALDLKAPTLSALKTKINKADADLRRVNNVKVVSFGGYYSSNVERGVVTLIESDHEAWVSFTVGNSVKRRKVQIDSLMLDTPETAAAIAAFKEANAKAKQAKELADGLREAIPRVKIEDLRAVMTADSE